MYLNFSASQILEENSEILDFLNFHDNYKIEEDLLFRTPKKVKLLETPR